MRPTDLPPLQRLIERLVQLLNRPADARLVCITARCAHGVKSIDIDRPTLALVLRGAKQVTAGQRAETLQPGDLLAMAPGARLDVENRPDAADGRYLTLGIPLCDEVLAATRLLWVGALQPGGMHFARVPGDALVHELAALADAVTADDEAQARLAVLNLLMVLARRGCSVVPLTTIAPRRCRSTKSANSSPKPNVPELVQTGVFIFIPANCVASNPSLSIITPPVPKKLVHLYKPFYDVRLWHHRNRISTLPIHRPYAFLKKPGKGYLQPPQLQQYRAS